MYKRKVWLLADMPSAKVCVSCYKQLPSSTCVLQLIAFAASFVLALYLQL